MSAAQRVPGAGTGAMGARAVSSPHCPSCSPTRPRCAAKAGRAPQTPTLKCEFQTPRESVGNYPVFFSLPSLPALSLASLLLSALLLGEEPGPGAATALLLRAGGEVLQPLSIPRPPAPSLLGGRDQTQLFAGQRGARGAMGTSGCPAGWLGHCGVLVYGWGCAGAGPILVSCAKQRQAACVKWASHDIKCAAAGWKLPLQASEQLPAISPCLPVVLDELIMDKTPLPSELPCLGPHLSARGQRALMLTQPAWGSLASPLPLLP